MNKNRPLLGVYQVNSDCFGYISFSDRVGQSQIKTSI